MTTKTGSHPREALAAALGGAALARVSGPESPCAVRLRGRDARRFANGMFTNNVRDLPVGRWNRSAVVDDRAHVEGFLDLLCEADDRFLAVLDGLPPEAFQERYGRFLLFDEVELEVAPLERLAVVGPTSEQALREAGWPVPGPGEFCSRPSGARVWAHRRAPGPSLELLVPADDPIALALPELGAEDLEVLRILAAVPDHPRDTEGRRLPHELNVREEMLHFGKGCYIGQETIHRVDVMGQVRRKLVRARFDRPVAPGAALRHEGVEVGRVTSAAEHPPGQGVALALVRVPADLPGCQLVTDEGVAGTVG